jgi:hypothetical protein
MIIFMGHIFFKLFYLQNGSEKGQYYETFCIFLKVYRMFIFHAIFIVDFYDCDQELLLEYWWISSISVPILFG